MDYRKFWFYAFTISPRLYNGNQKFAYEVQSFKIRILLKFISRHFCLYPEFDDKGRLHYHGIVRVYDKVKLHKTKHKFDREVGFLKYERLMTFKDHLTYLVYCRKQYEKGMFDPIIYKRIKSSAVIYKEDTDLDDGVIVKPKVKSSHDITEFFPVRSCDTDDRCNGQIVLN